MPPSSTPQRIVCLTEETTECLYRWEEDHRVVGISAFTVRPARAKAQKRVVSQFTKSDLVAILDVEPDLVLAFSDLQADVCRELIQAGVEVHCFNQRSVAGILAMVRNLAGMIGAVAKGEALARELEAYLETVRQAAARFPRRPRVYFEEWPDPIITGIGWVSECVELAGGEDVFPEHRRGQGAQDRMVANYSGILEREPEVMLASWCGKKFRPDQVRARPGWADSALVQKDKLFEIDSATILQPGPAALTDGLYAVHRILADVVDAQPGPPPPVWDAG